MSQTLLSSILIDLQDWETGTPPEKLAVAAVCVRDMLESGLRRAEHRLNAGGVLTWLYDSQSAKVVVTYPNGMARIRCISR